MKFIFLAKVNINFADNDLYREFWAEIFQTQRKQH